MPSNLQKPVFVAEKAPLQGFIAFIHSELSGWGPHLAAVQGDDFDEVLEMIPPNVKGWQIYSRDDFHIIAGSDQEKDKTHLSVPEVCIEELEVLPAMQQVVSGTLVFKDRSDAWGCWCIVGRVTDNKKSDTIRSANRCLKVEGKIATLDPTTSCIYDSGQTLVSIIPTVKQIKQYGKTIAEWQMMREANGETVETSAEIEVRTEIFMKGASLPDGWEELDNVDLLAVIEGCEAHILRTTGKTPAEIEKERKLAQKSESFEREVFMNDPRTGEE